MAELEPDFHVEREVVLEHWLGNQLDVDAAMWPREPQLWKAELPVFAVEFKMPMLFRTGAGWQSTKDFTAWAAQSVDYANSLWRGPFRDQRLRIFTRPSVTSPFKEVGPSNPESPTFTDPAFDMTQLVWQLGVGELAKLERDG